ncbi:hypothetical protein KUTeg_017833 [Tegillarca granosa]|uniref:Protein kinase domain-containing protein n=1 Tax=Tegillarca granosa TaxID=220873 RepID=A0ABQ9EGB5_TEGGR|nr:hypothetical protein KUTeg_017833 [Tegillarca granosa]
MIYWRDGMYLHHGNGYFMLESVRIPQLRERLTQSGILITVQSKEEDYSVLGMIVDQLDDLLLEHYPDTLSPLDHFTVEHCSRIMLVNESITCKKGVKVPLVELVPELFMTELPEKFQIKYSELKIENSKGSFLGVGITGSVYKGHYGNLDVALKFYHGVPSDQEKCVSYSLDSGRDTLSIKSTSWRVMEEDEEIPVQRKGLKKQESAEYANIGSVTASFDCDEANSFKAWKAFTEMRQEVSLTSKLQHPCIVSFIGITVRPKLLMALELAPFGSLRSVLDARLNDREPFNKYRDKDKIFDALFSKDLTFKMVYQIAKGLEYLHKCFIVYRDLKSDNILVTSLEISSPINVKLSDYGISKIQSSGGNLGLVGTPGYQAPEIIDGLAYDEKVDIFSFSMVIHEIISGERPYVEYKNLAQITRAIKYESKRPNLQDYNIDSKFPFLEDLMVKCWHQSAGERPSASVITSVSYMRSVQFLCQHKRYVTQDRLRHGEIDSVADISEGREIEVYRQPCFGHPKRTNKYEKLGAIPTAIDVLYNEDEEKTCKNVLVALHDGRLHVYLPTTKESVTRSLKTKSVVMETVQSGWYLSKTMQLTNYTMSCITHVPCQKEIWFGCEREIVIINTNHILIEGRIKLGTQFSRHNIQSLVYWDERVWCLLQATAILLEFDVHLRCPTHIFNCEDPHPMKMNVATYISNLSEQNDEEMEVSVFDHSFDTSDGDKESRPPTFGSDELKQWADSVLPVGGSDESESDEDFVMVKNKVQGQIVTGQSNFPEESLSGPSENLTLPPAPLPRHRSAEYLDSDPSSIPPTVPKRRPLPKQTELNVPRAPVRKAQSISAVGEETPKERLMTKSSTLPNISSRAHLMNKINIGSAIVVKDTLWVGRSNGDILVININQNNKDICEHGEVISVMYQNNDDDCKMDVSVETLVSVGDLVVSFIKRT